jgi:hypothetical protein
MLDDSVSVVQMRRSTCCELSYDTGTTEYEWLLWLPDLSMSARLHARCLHCRRVYWRQDTSRRFHELLRQVRRLHRWHRRIVDTLSGSDRLSETAIAVVQGETGAERRRFRMHRLRELRLPAVRDAAVQRAARVCKLH